MTFEVSLFESRRDYIVLFTILLTVLSTNIFFKYQTYQKLKSHTVARVEAKVINQYQKQKSDKKYTVLKLESLDGYHFYTTSHEDLKNLIFHTISLKIITKNIKFIDLFTGFYAPSFDIRVTKIDKFKTKIDNFIQSQHKNQLTKELFSALFIAKPISKRLRDVVSNYGISHLIAISGFHLGVLFFILYTVFSPPYKYFQNRYFPYRNLRFDLTVLTLFLLTFYLYLLGFIPSLVRSYIMMIIGFILYDRFIKVISFEVLFVAVLLILSFIPSFFFSISFWFSVSGVFFIFIFLKFFPSLKTWQTLILLNIWVYIMMLPIVHFIFPKFTFLQLFSPLLSILFIIFYPLELFLHLINQGGVLDGVIIKLFQHTSKIYNFETPLWFLMIFVTLSLYFSTKRENLKG